MMKQCGKQQGANVKGWVIAASILAAMVLLMDRPLARQREPGSEQDDQVTVNLRSDLVSFTVTVSLPGGESLTTLGQEDFLVYEDGKRQTVTHFAAVDTQVDIVFMVDDSGSMRDHLGLVKLAAERFMDRKRPQDRVAVVAFGRQVELLARLTRDRSPLKEAIARIPQDKGTSFYDALYLVADELLRGEAARKALIALSDGVDSTSFYTFEQASRMLERAGATAYFIEVDTEAEMIAGLMSDEFDLSPSQLEKYRQAFRPDDPPLRYRNAAWFTGREKVGMARALYQLARDELRQLAERTGGQVFALESFSQLSRIYDQIGSDLGTLYSIGYYPTNTRRDGSWRSLRVQVNAPGAKARARSGYWAPSK